jgi:hypothetical protein
LGKLNIGTPAGMKIPKAGGPRRDCAGDNKSLQLSP